VLMRKPTAFVAALGKRSGSTLNQQDVAALGKRSGSTLNQQDVA